MCTEKKKQAEKWSTSLQANRTDYLWVRSLELCISACKPYDALGRATDYTGSKERIPQLSLSDALARW